PPELRAAVDTNAQSKIAFRAEHDDARDHARLAIGLTPEDFAALPRFHAYANLVSGGTPSGWAYLKTLPPTAATADPERVRRAVRALRPSSPSATAPTPE